MPVTMNSRVQTARSLALDQVASEVSAALEARNVRVILLKGAAIANWLYDDGAVRPYNDVDLLVAPADRARSEGALRELGFTPKLQGVSPIEETPYGRVWLRGGTALDFHASIRDIGLAPNKAWELLVEGTEVMEVGGRRLEVLGPPARALHVALHAAQHGLNEPKPRQDLARALSELPIDTWREAADLARRLDAAAAMAAGLRLDPEGQLLADALDLPKRIPLGLALRAGKASRMDLSLSRVLAADGLVAKVRLVATGLVPTPARLRYLSPLARSGPLGLALAYLGRPVALLIRTPALMVSIGRAARRR